MFSHFKEAYLHILSPNARNTISRERRRMLLIKLLLFITAAILFGFSLLHTVIGENSLFIALLDVLAGIVVLYSALSLTSLEKIDRATLLSTFSLFIFFILYINTNQNNSFGLIWTVFFPIFALVVNKTLRGLLISLLFIALVVFMAYQGIGVWQSGAWDFTSFLRLTLALSIFTLLFYIYEVTLEKVYQQEQEAMDVLQELSLNDHLTGIANRRRINNLLDIEFERARRYRTPFSIVLFDIDHFKEINDHYGHLAGDTVLKSFANQVNQSIRKTETLGRWGGEEFILILSQSDLNAAYLVAEKIRKIIAKTRFEDIDEEITCSFGVAIYQDGITIDELLEEADQALYQAKENGRNQVIVYGQPDFKPVIDPHGHIKS